MMPGLALVRLQTVFDLFVAAEPRPDAVDQVRPIEVADQRHRLPQPETLDDVAAHLLGGGGGEGVDRRLGKRRAQPAELAVLRPEVVAPVADAVRFVDGDEAHAPARELPLKAGAAIAHQPLGRDVEQPQPPVAERRQRRRALVGGRGAVETRRRHAALDQAVDLVLHQRDERRDDERDAGRVADQRRRLKADRFAAAGRHDDEAVAAIEDGVDRLPLQRTKALEPPVVREDAPRASMRT